jgi:hypothetical protein
VKNWLRIVAVLGIVMVFSITAPALTIAFNSTFTPGGGELSGTNAGVVTPSTFANGVWQVKVNNIDWINTTYGFQAPPSGGQIIDMNGFTCSVGTNNCAAGSALGEVKTANAITFTAGDVYQLTFWLSGNPEYQQATYALSTAQQNLIKSNQMVYAGFTNATDTTTFTAQNYLFTAAAGSQTGSTLNWVQQFSSTFTATAGMTSMYLFFQSAPSFMNMTGFTNDLQSWGALVAGVQVNDLGPAGVPEPATFGLLGAGLFALAAIRRRK